MKEEERLKNTWQEEFELVRRNSIYFLELYWNKIYPDEKVELTDEQKQKFYDKYKMTPFYDDMDVFLEHRKREDELRAKGMKDWEAFL